MPCKCNAAMPCNAGLQNHNQLLLRGNVDLDQSSGSKFFFSKSCPYLIGLCPLLPPLFTCVDDVVNLYPRRMKPIAFTVNNFVWYVPDSRSVFGLVWLNEPCHILEKSTLQSIGDQLSSSSRPLITPQFNRIYGYIMCVLFFQTN